jgi:hypothetical protein
MTGMSIAATRLGELFRKRLGLDSAASQTPQGIKGQILSGSRRRSYFILGESGFVQSARAAGIDGSAQVACRQGAI